MAKGALTAVIGMIWDSLWEKTMSFIWQAKKVSTAM